MGYLLSWRMTLAMRWLGEPGISMADIAERLGYGSASAFSVAFTRYARTSPGNMPASGRRSVCPGPP